MERERERESVGQYQYGTSLSLSLSLSGWLVGGYVRNVCSNYRTNSVWLWTGAGNAGYR